MKKTKGFLGLIVLSFVLFYAQLVFAQWQYEVFDTHKSNNTRPQSSNLSTAIGNDGTVHVLYLKDKHKVPFIFNSVFYAYRDEAGWHNEDLNQFIKWEPNLLEVYSLSMSLDSNSNVYISYSNRSNLYLMTNASGTWVTETIVSYGEDGLLVRVSKIVFDSHDNPHLFYGSFSDCLLHHTYKDSSGWHTETVEEVPCFHSIDLDSNDNPHVIYLQNDGGGNCFLTYAYKDSTGWHAEIINEDRELYCFTICSMTLDSNNKAHILFKDAAKSDTTFYYTTNASDAWVTEAVVSLPHADGTFMQFSNEIVLDSEGNPHLSYHFSNNWSFVLTFYLGQTSIWHAKRDSSGWHRELVKHAGTCELVFWPLLPSYIFGNAIKAPPSIKLDVNGDPHIFYLSTFYIYPYYLQFFPEFPFKGVITNWNHTYIVP